MEMKSEPALISSPVFHFPRDAARNHAVCQEEKLLEIRVGHFFSYATAISDFSYAYRQNRMKSLSVVRVGCGYLRPHLYGQRDGACEGR
jgi:hypothetical protein